MERRLLAYVLAKFDVDRFPNSEKDSVQIRLLKNGPGKLVKSPVTRLRIARFA